MKQTFSNILLLNRHTSKSLSTERGYSLSELARRVDMAKSAISRYFNGKREFPLNKINDFASVLGVSPEYLLGVTPNIDILPMI